MMKKFLLLLPLLILGTGPLPAQKCPSEDFKKCIHVMDSLMNEHCHSYGRLYLHKVVRNGNSLDFHFTSSLADFPIRPSDIQWMRVRLKENLPQQYSSLNIGKIFCGNDPVSMIVVSPPGNNGKAPASLKLFPNHKETALVNCGITPSKGLTGRHIAMWQSHGYYYNQKYGCWMWQRPCVFQTVEDLYTQSYVVPLLAPMLENAGANVLLPRERDWHTTELIIDNDECENESGRIHGKVTFKGKWKKVNFGFADDKAYYRDADNPFHNGSSMQRSCTTPEDKESLATWSADIPERGEYAVYVSYPASVRNTTEAQYTVHALGHDVPVKVNQKMGGDGWVYLGTYEFEAGYRTLISLSSRSSSKGMVVADAVKIGGGVGNIARGNSSDSVFVISGKPRFAEGARYFMQWSGVPEKVWNPNNGNEDYKDDFISRGAWVNYLSGGSWTNPKETGQRIPIDLSFAFHSDAFSTPDSTIIGTLGIYTLYCNKSTALPSGDCRETCRELTDFVQTQVVDDIRSQWNPHWRRRMLWNRSYSESRTPPSPAVLLELLSHMNFEDMKYGLDPAFRFTVARACYKAILKYLSMHYGCPYVVQPLPIQAFSAKIVQGGNGPAVKLEWEAQPDSLEQTALPSSFIIYTRLDGQGWDAGKTHSDRAKDGKYSTVLPISKGHIHSFKIIAVNDGGRSFPSEILSVGLPANQNSSQEKVLIINNFHRTSGPVWFDTPTFAGFYNNDDSGVPYIRDWNFIGDQFEFRRFAKYVNDSNSGFGSSYTDYADVVTSGNTFDYPFCHGRSILKAGYAFESCSSEAFAHNSSLSDGCSALDIICGKECVVKTATESPLRGGIYTEDLLTSVSKAAETGCNILISGAYIASDAFGTIYQFTYPSRKSIQSFVQNVLGFSLLRQHGSKTGQVKFMGSTYPHLSFPCKPCGDSYCVESPDALRAVGMGSETLMIYVDTGLPAGVTIDHRKYKVAAFGFPLEIIEKKTDRDKIIATVMKYFHQQGNVIVSDNQ